MYIRMHTELASQLQHMPASRSFDHVLRATTTPNSCKNVSCNRLGIYI